MIFTNFPLERPFANASRMFISTFKSVAFDVQKLAVYQLLNSPATPLSGWILLTFLANEHLRLTKNIFMPNFKPVEFNVQKLSLTPPSSIPLYGFCSFGFILSLVKKRISVFRLSNLKISSSYRHSFFTILW